MSSSAAEQITGIIPVVVAAGVATTITKSVFQGTQPARGKRRSKGRSKRRRNSLGYGDFSNLGI